MNTFLKQVEHLLQFVESDVCDNYSYIYISNYISRNIREQLININTLNVNTTQR